MGIGSLSFISPRNRQEGPWSRAVQTLIENLSNSTQVQIIIGALQDSVVPLIKDLNGNHVIQRSLQKFTPQAQGAALGHAVGRGIA